MFSLILENQSGAQLSFGMGSPFTITEIEGLNPPNATINVSEVALIDGGKYNSGKVNMRTLNIAFVIKSDPAKNRLAVYNVLKAKQQVRMYYKSKYRDVYIDGYIESINVGHFEEIQSVTVSILCPSPYFRAAQEIVNELSAIINQFHFPFASMGGKNILPYPYYQTTRTDSGLTYTDNGNGTITINGTNTATGSAKAFLCRSRDRETFTLPVGTYILSGGISATQRVIINYETEGSSSATSLAVSSGGEVTFTVTEEISQYPLQVGIYSSSGASYDNVTIYPMIRLASVSDATWEPYDYKNIVLGYIDATSGLLVTNDGDVDCGMVIQLYASAAVTNPKILDYDTGEYFGLNYSMQAGDVITINTNKGEKTVTLLRDAVETNIFNYIMQGSTWFQLSGDGNTFVYEVGSGLVAHLLVTFNYNYLYEGV